VESHVSQKDARPFGRLRGGYGAPSTRCKILNMGKTAAAAVRGVMRKGGNQGFT